LAGYHVTIRVYTGRLGLQTNRPGLLPGRKKDVQKVADFIDRFNLFSGISLSNARLHVAVQAAQGDCYFSSILEIESGLELGNHRRRLVQAEDPVLDVSRLKKVFGLTETVDCSFVKDKDEFKRIGRLNFHLLVVRGVSLG